jgi:SAM-dependent methyltransferase
LLLGCGRSWKRNISTGGRLDFSGDTLTTIDIDPGSKPSIVMDLGELPYGGRLPFADESFDELHAYDVLEHIGTQGDWRGFFTEFSEYHRVLRPGGKFFILVPIGEDAYGDPGHSRFFSCNHFGFLSQGFYDHPQQTTVVTDYRWFWKKSFDISYMEKVEGHHIAVILVKA